MSSSTPATSIYDRVPHPSLAFAASHPDRLATLASLWGLSPAPSQRCRVLEIGCGAAGNLLPMAAGLPDSEFVGIDLSDSQVAAGRELAQAAGLTNVRLECRDLCELDLAWGKFDYIIAHGVFSWVAAEVQHRLLALCRAQLQPQGIAYVNYNTFPGWQFLALLRDALQWHTQLAPDTADRIRQARELVHFLLAYGPPASTPYGNWLRSELRTLEKATDSYLFHAYLNVRNQPFYFHEFMARAEGAGLQYVCDSEWSVNWLGGLTGEAERDLRQLAAQPLRREQLLDLLANRSSRQSLLCHAEAAVEQGPQWDRSPLWFAALLGEDAASGPAGTRTFRTRQGKTVTTRSSEMAAVLERLRRAWPGGMPAEELARVVQAARQADQAPGAGWRDDLRQCVLAGIVEVSLTAPRCAATVPERPHATSLARCQASRGQAVTNLRHQNVALGDLDRQILAALEGHSVAELERQLAGRVTAAATRESLQRLCEQSLLLARSPGGG